MKQMLRMMADRLTAGEALVLVTVTASSGVKAAVGVGSATWRPFGVRNCTFIRARNDLPSRIRSTTGGNVPAGTASGRTILWPSTCSIHS